MEALVLYHRLDGLSDGSGLKSVQYPPMLQEGDERGLRRFIERLADFMARQPEVDYLPAPANPRERARFRRKVAEDALPGIRQHALKAYHRAVDTLRDPGLKRLVKEAVSHAPPEFFKAPSSSTGTHHPADEINSGGLLVHTLRDVKVGRMLARCFRLSREEEDQVAAALLLHDIQKGGIPWKKEFTGEAPYSATDPAHGPIAEHWLQQFEEVCGPNCATVEHAVGNHMAQWNAPAPAPPKTILDQIVSYADYLASQDDVYVRWQE